MPSGLATLQLASATDVALATLGVAGRQFGVPEEGLTYEGLASPIPIPQFSAEDPLEEGDIYVATLADWLGATAIPLPDRQAAGAAIKAALGLPRVRAVVRLVGFIPLSLRIPRLGGPMTFSPHGKIVLRGDFFSNSIAQEIWSASMSYDVVGPDVGAMPDTIGSTALASIADSWGNGVIIPAFTGAEFGPEVRLTEVAYYKAGTDGRSTLGTWERYFLNTPIQGTGTVQLPYNVAVVVTLDALGATGGRFGRFYLPTANSLVVGGLFPAAYSAALVDNVTDALTAVNSTISTAVGQTCELVVASARGSGENRPVRSLRVGRVPDTMRSRRGSLAEDYQVNPFQSV